MEWFPGDKNEFNPLHIAVSILHPHTLDQETEEQKINTWSQVRIRIHFYGIYDFLPCYSMTPKYIMPHILLCLWGTYPQDSRMF